MATRFPFFSIRSERIFGPECLAPMWEYLAWSANVMFTGMYPRSGFKGQPGPVLGHANPGTPMYGGRKLRLVEVRGDWEQHAQVFKLKHFYASNDICHICRASKVNPAIQYTDFRKQPTWRGTERTHQQFLLEEIGAPPQLHCIHCRIPLQNDPHRYNAHHKSRVWALCKRRSNARAPEAEPFWPRGQSYNLPEGIQLLQSIHEEKPYRDLPTGVHTMVSCGERAG